MKNYFNTLSLREQLTQLGKCDFMDASEFTKGTKAPELKGILASELKINEDTLKLLLND